MKSKVIRLKRLFNENSNTSVIVPLDHGATFGPIKGIENLEDVMYVLSKASPDAIIMHKGNIRRMGDIIPKNIGIIMHLSASINFSPNVDTKVLVGSVEEAVRLGADGVSIHLNIGNETDIEMIRDFGKVSEECFYWGMPLLVMIYPRIEKKSCFIDQTILIRHCVRMCEEIGADIVKIPYVGDIKSFKKIIEFANIPVLIAGGEKADDDRELLDLISNIIKVGGSGVSMGRNIFQNDNPEEFLNSVCRIVHKQ